jgi:hypothetical protein
LADTIEDVRTASGQIESSRSTTALAELRTLCDDAEALQQLGLDSSLTWGKGTRLTEGEHFEKMISASTTVKMIEFDLLRAGRRLQEAFAPTLTPDEAAAASYTPPQDPTSLKPARTARPKAATSKDVTSNDPSVRLEALISGVNARKRAVAQELRRYLSDRNVARHWSSGGSHIDENVSVEATTRFLTSQDRKRLVMSFMSPFKPDEENTVSVANMAAHE